MQRLRIVAWEVFTDKGDKPSLIYRVILNASDLLSEMVSLLFHSIYAHYAHSRKHTLQVWGVDKK